MISQYRPSTHKSEFRLLNVKKNFGVIFHILVLGKELLNKTNHFLNAISDIYESYLTQII